MEPTVTWAPTIELDLTDLVLSGDRCLGLRQRLEGRRLERNAVELDLRAIAQERLALAPKGRHR